MDPDVGDLVSRIHETTRKVVLSATGGGATAAAWLLGVPGGSRTVLEVVVPYAQESLAGFLGRLPASYCSAATTREMAARARSRAEWLAPGERVVGVGCTASLRSDRPKRGDHRAHVACSTETGGVVQSITLAKEQRSRDQEEALVSRLVLNALAEGFGLAERVALPLLPGEEVTRQEHPGGLLAALLAGKASAVCVEPAGRMLEGGPPPGVLLAGSFNPLHDGHCSMALAAAKVAGRPAAFELSVVNADKPPLTEGEVRKRMAQFAWKGRLWLTRAPTFVAKARLFPGATFAVGVDTAVRVVQPRFYGDSVEAMREALGEIRRAGCRFLAAGRVMEGVFTELRQVSMPEEFRDLFTGISADQFRVDVSSTQLREAKG
jgi:hypothetical protein